MHVSGPCDPASYEPGNMAGHTLSSSLDVGCLRLPMQPSYQNVRTFSMFPHSLDSRVSSVATGHYKLFLDYVSKEHSEGMGSAALNVHNAQSSFQDAQSLFAPNSHIIAMSKYHTDIGNRLNTPVASSGSLGIEPSVASVDSHGIGSTVASLCSHGSKPSVAPLSSYGTETYPRPLSAFTYVGRYKQHSVTTAVHGQNMFRTHEYTPTYLQANLASSSKVLPFPTHQYHRSSEAYQSPQNEAKNRCSKDGLATYDHVRYVHGFSRNKETFDVGKSRQSCKARLTQFPRVTEDEIRQPRDENMTSKISYQLKGKAHMRRRMRQNRHSARWPYQAKNMFSPKITAGDDARNLQNDVSVTSDASRSGNKQGSDIQFEKLEKHLDEIPKISKGFPKLETNFFGTHQDKITKQNQFGSEKGKTNPFVCKSAPRRAINRASGGALANERVKDGENDAPDMQNDDAYGEDVNITQCSCTPETDADVSVTSPRTLSAMNKNPSPKSNNPYSKFATPSNVRGVTHTCPQHAQLGRMKGALGMDGLEKEGVGQEVSQTPDCMDGDVRKSFRCPQCRYLTDRKNNLKRHIVTMHHTSARVLECCGALFTSKASLRDHVSLFHRGGYRCQICGRNFCRKALLRRHLTVHSGQKDFACHLCGYATSHKSNLERHQRVHARKSAFVTSHHSLRELSACCQQPLEPNSQYQTADYRPSKHRAQSSTETAGCLQQNGDVDHLLSKCHVKSSAETTSCRQENVPSEYLTKSCKNEKEVIQTNHAEGSRMDDDNALAQSNKALSQCLKSIAIEPCCAEQANGSVQKNPRSHANNSMDGDNTSALGMATGTSGTAEISRSSDACTDMSLSAETLGERPVIDTLESTDPELVLKYDRSTELSSWIVSCPSDSEINTLSDLAPTFKQVSSPKTEHGVAKPQSTPPNEYGYSEYPSRQTNEDDFASLTARIFGPTLARRRPKLNKLGPTLGQSWANDVCCQDFLYGGVPSDTDQGSQEADACKKQRGQSRQFCLPNRLRETHQQTIENLKEAEDFRAFVESTCPGTRTSFENNRDTGAGFTDCVSETKENENPAKTRDKLAETISAKNQRIDKGTAQEIFARLSTEGCKNEVQQQKDFNHCPSVFDKDNCSDLKQTCSDSDIVEHNPLMLTPPSAQLRGGRCEHERVRTRRPLQVSKLRICCLPYRCSECGVSFPCQKELHTHVCERDAVQKGLLHMSVTNAVRKGCILASVDSERFDSNVAVLQQQTELISG